MAASILLSYPKPHPSLLKNRVRGGSPSLLKNMVLSDECDFPYKNIGVLHPALMGGVLMYFIMNEQNRKCHVYVDACVCVCVCVFVFI